MDMLALLALVACTGSQPPADTGTPPAKGPVDPAILAAISPEGMKAIVDVLASDAMGGRVPGSLGSDAARSYIIDQMTEAGLEPLGTDGFEYPYENSPRSDRWMLDENGQVVPQATTFGYDLVGLIPGSDPDLSHEYLVVMAHHDHLGVTEEGEVYNGAYDNASAVAMCLELARVMRDADATPGRSIVFVFTDDEETGLVGSREWIEASTVPREDIVFGISADPLGRGILPDYKPIALMGLDRSPDLRARWEAVAAFSEEPVVFVHRDIVPVFSSDQEPWYELEEPIPAVWFTNPGMSFYHTPDDDPVTIDYGMLLASARHMLEVLTDLGGDDQRYTYDGPGPLDGAMATGAAELLQGVLASSYPTAEQRAHAEFLLSQVDAVVQADTVEALDGWEGVFFAAAYYLLFELPTDHPGEVPPPWPE